MKLSTDRILTTHVGSLPRPDDMVDLLLRKDHGEPYDPAEFERCADAAVAAIVARQVSTGIDVVSDGETSKVSYATYIKDRLSGFGGEQYRPKPHLDLADHPKYRERLAQMAGPRTFHRLCCVAPIEVADRAAVGTDIRRFQAALAGSGATEGFLNAASPGVIASFQPNRYYPTHEAYIEAVTAAMRIEYEAITKAGLLLQIDCPDLAMSRHTGFQDLTEAEFLKRAEFQIEALNAALADVPAGQVRMHICWGNYEGPHDHDIDLAKILGIVLKAKPQAICFEAANPRHAHEWTVWRDAKLPDDKVLIPGVLDTTTNFVEHPELVAQRICQFAAIVGRERVLAGTDCGLATFAGQNRIDPDIAFKKLAALADGARRASARLWP